LSLFFKTLRHLARAVAALIVLWLAAALLGGLIPRNSSWQQSKEGATTTIWLVSNGLHTGIIVPVAAGAEDLSLTFRPTDLQDPDDAGSFLAFGWGDREFYMNTPEWKDVRAGTVLTAMIGSSSSLIHVDHLDHPAELADPRPIQVTAAELARLVAAIRASLALDGDGRAVPLPGYGRRDVFYDARGRYSLLNTCNVWTGDMLARAGIRMGLWTPLSPALMWRFPAHQKAK
jgi:uncharacterized protein (TIGR02117 family)